MATKVLLDTDIGSDIDDAVCLAYLLAQPECELLGITTVSGEATKRAMLASALCHVAGKQAPIHPGAEAPLDGHQRQPQAPQATALGRWQHDQDFEQDSAVPFLRECIRRYPGEVTLLAIGPLTNVAQLFEADPEIPGLLKGLVLMCGDWTERSPRPGGLEWNARCDPVAAATVYRAPVATHRSVGLNVTERVTMAAAEVRARFQSKLLQPVLDFAEVWFEQRHVVTFHDPLAATTIFNDRVCRFGRGQVEVDLSDAAARGWTSWRQEAASGPHEIAMDVDPAAFFTEYFRVVKGGS